MAFSHHRLCAIWSTSHFEEDHAHLREIPPAVADLASQSESFGFYLQFAIENDPFIDALL